MEGFLKKLNSQGVWKDRYCQLQNGYFMTYKPKDKKGPSNEIKESIDLKTLVSVNINGDDCLEILLNNGTQLLYKGPELHVWLGTITVRADWSQDKLKPPIVDETSHSTELSDAAPAPPSTAISQSMEGLLKKKNSQGVWKDRYCQLRNSFLMTYKPLADKSGPSDELKETIDLKKLAKITVTVADILEITLSTGDFYQYKGASLDVWIDLITKRSTWALLTASAFSTPKTPFEVPEEMGRRSSDPADPSEPQSDADNAGNTSAATVEKRSMEGLLRKKNSAGVWKDRFCQLQTAYMVTYKPNKDRQPSSEVKETIDLRNLSKTFITSEDVLEITLVNGDMFEFSSAGAGSVLEDWQEAIRVRSKWALQGLGNRSSARVASMKGLAPSQQVPQMEADQEDNDISGWLMKKSHSKYQGYQTRFVKLEGPLLRYFKSDSAAEAELGSANLLTAEFVRPFDSTPDCTTFELQDEDRVFAFQTRSHSEMQRWVLHLQTARQVAQQQQLQQQSEQQKEATPIRIRWFDELGEQGFSAHITEDLDEMYPPSHSEAYAEMTSLKQHLACATELAEYLKEFVPEVQKCESRPARYDILAVMMALVNDALKDRLQPVLSTAAGPAEGADSDVFVRHDLLEWASLGDLLGLVDWLTRYQHSLARIVCPVRLRNKEEGVEDAAKNRSSAASNPKSCCLFDYIGPICGLYVHGGTLGAKAGAAAHLYEHCRKVWDSVLRSPEEMLQRHQNGTFYTHAPTDMWEAINQHIQLAMSTQSPILHVMIADKVVSSLTPLIDQISEYVAVTMTQDTTDRAELKEIELEFVSALANDTATHIEEVIQLVEAFTIAEIRERIDEIFDPLTTNLVKCGQTCLNRLTSVVMFDVHELLDAVFMPDWLEGNQICICINTISDYMRDLLEFLVPFWAEKLVHTLLEAVVLGYTRNIVFPRRSATTSLASKLFSVALGSDSDGPTHSLPAAPASPAAAPKNPVEKSGGFFSSMFKSKASAATPPPKETLTSPAPATNTFFNLYNAGRCAVDADSLGRIAQDINTLNSFFSRKTSQTTATDYLEILNDVSLMLFTEFHNVLKHAIARISEFPSASEAVFQTGLSCLKLRDDVTRDELQIFELQLRPALDCAPSAMKQNEVLGIAEGRLGLFYNDLVPKELLQAAMNSRGGAAAGMTLAQRLKNMSNIPLFQNKDSLAEKSKEGFQDGEESEKEDDKGLLGGVMEALSQQEEEDRAWQQSKEEELLKEEEMRCKVGILSYDGYLEKKSPAHNLWQRRWFKLSTREAVPANLDRPYVYNLMWYKKEGGAVIKAVDADNLASIAVLQTPRPLAYLQSSRSLALQSDAALKTDAVTVVAHGLADCSLQQVATLEPFVAIRLLQVDGKESILRGSKVDRVIKWVNLLALAAELSYDPVEHIWKRS